MTAGRSDGLHHADAVNYPLVPLAATHASYPVVTQAVPINPSGYSVSYVQFLPDGHYGSLRLSFDGADADQISGWSAWVDKSTAPNVHSFQQIPLTVSTWTGELEIPDFQTYQSVTLIAVNLMSFGDASLFTYAAELKSVHKVASRILTDSLVYPGATRLFKYRLYNVAPNYDVIRVSASDDRGWVNLAPFDRSVGPGEYVDVDIPVTPSVGALLGTHASLTFRAISRGDTTVVDSAQIQVVAVLQIGDVTNDGGVDIADLTALIACLYLSGPPPEPVWQSGNFDCQGSLDIQDLTALISFLYLAGPPCQCNPF